MTRKSIVLLLTWLMPASLLVYGAAKEDAPKNVVWKKDNAKMVLIPAGFLKMGDSMNDPEEWMKRSRPVHTVELDGFYMDAHEVTVGQFKQFVNETGYTMTATNYNYNRWDDVARYSPTDNHPMVYVSWTDAGSYARWTGKRLPTEAEWEYAARGGVVGKRYPCGDEITHDDANYYGTGGRDKWNEATAPVGSFIPNGYGLYDMAGNVWEWCSDWFDESYYSRSPSRNPTGPDKETRRRVQRGGSWYSNAYRLRVARRIHDFPGCTDYSRGFRCVVPLSQFLDEANE